MLYPRLFSSQGSVIVDYRMIVRGVPATVPDDVVQRAVSTEVYEKVKAGLTQLEADFRDNDITFDGRFIDTLV